MKPIHKRLYTAIPRPPPAVIVASSTPRSRVRSNSASSSSSTSSARSLHTASSSTLSFSFFDSPPTVTPPSSRPTTTNLVASTRLVEVKGEVAESHQPGHNNPQSQSHSSGPPPYPLAFTSGQSDASSSHLPPNGAHTLFFPYPFSGPVASLDTSSTGLVEATLSTTRGERTRYHLDVGAYGIPKHSKDVRVAGCDGRGNLALGPQASESTAVQVGEDAYFVRDNAMGVADGVGGWAKVHRPCRPDESSPSALFAQRLMQYCSEEVDAALTSHEEFPLEDDLQDELEESIEDLTDGLDVLMILERAYDKTMRAHVVTEPSDYASFPEKMESSSQANCSHGETLNSPNPSHPTPIPTPRSMPLLSGSATALLAILDHPSTSPSEPSTQSRSSFLFPRPRKQEPHRGAVIRIAHLGDCMGMLIRGEDIVWRTEEMWWNFNTPVQLGPQSSTRPQDARVFTLPVQADDILILASDGLSDNLWDEDILDEVTRFRRSFISPSTTLPSSNPSNPSTLGRRTLAGMLSEALCSRARCVSERRPPGSHKTKGRHHHRGGNVWAEPKTSTIIEKVVEEEDEIPFARRAREQGRWFQGGKLDDISVLIAVVSPSESVATS